MNFKTTLILALVLAVGIAAVVFLNKQDEKKAAVQEREGKILPLEKEDVQEIIIEPAGIHCVRDSNEWKIIEPVRTDGDESAIGSVANFFSWAKVERTVVSEPENYTPYGLNPARGTLIVVHTNGTDTLYVGDKTPTGSFVFARLNDQPEVFLTSTSLQSNVEKTLFNLRDKNVLDFSKSNVRRFVLKNSHGTFELESKGAGSSWTIVQPGDYDADNAKVNTMLNRVSSERVDAFVEEDPVGLSQYGLQRPQISLDLFLGENRAQKSLNIGNGAGDAYYAQDASRRPVFEVDSAFVGLLDVDLFELRNKELADFSTTDVNRFELEFSGTTIVCEKDTAETWQMLEPTGRTPKSWKISSIVRNASQLAVLKFVDESPASSTAYGMANPARAVFYQGDTKRVSLELASVNGNAYVRVNGEPAIYQVEFSVYETLTPALDDISDPVETDVESDST